MSHQSNTTALRRTVEECDLRAVLLERIGVVHSCCVGVWMHRLTVSWLISDLCHAITINTNFVAVHDFETRLIGLAEEPGMVSIDSRTIFRTYPRAFLTTASASSSTSK
jgi:hypothetical protein